jgi:hypothetical protein
MMTTSEIDALLAEFGRQVTFRKFPTSPDESGSPWLGPSAEDADMTEVTGYAVEDKGPPGRRDRIVTGADSRAVMNMLARTGSDLEGFQEMHDGSNVYRIDSIRRIAFQSTTLLYELRVAR